MALRHNPESKYIKKKETQPVNFLDILHIANDDMDKLTFIGGVLFVLYTC